MGDPLANPRPNRNGALITAIGLDGPGILARLTGKVSELHGNVVDLQQTLIGRYFAVVMLVDLSNTHLDFAAFRDALGQEGEAIGVKVLVAHEDAFRAMHRV